MRGGLCPCEHSFNFAIVVVCNRCCLSTALIKLGAIHRKWEHANEEPIPLTSPVRSLIHLRPPCPHESRLSVARAHTLYANVTL